MRNVLLPDASTQKYPGEAFVTVAGKPGKAMADQIIAADKVRLKEQVDELSKADMLAVEEAIGIHLAMPRALSAHHSRPRRRYNLVCVSSTTAERGSFRNPDCATSTNGAALYAATPVDDRPLSRVIPYAEFNKARVAAGLPPICYALDR